MSKNWQGLWHCNPETGNVGRCYAEKGKCPFPEALHNRLPEASAQAFEVLMDKDFLESLSKGKRKLESYSLQNEKIFPIFSKADERSDPAHFTLAEVEVAMAGAKVSCQECGKALGGDNPGIAAITMETYGQGVECANCSETVWNTEAVIEPNVNSPTYGAVEADNVKRMTWYHFSENPHWDQSILEDEELSYVHLGGEVAAADRAYSIGGSSAYYLYVVSVAEDAQVEDEIEQDDESDYKPSGEKDVYRYLNRYEDIGSISVAVKPSKIKIHGKASFTREQAGKIGTYRINSSRAIDFISDYNDRIRENY